ncbi:hypothetical protein [Parapusillimonas granuli]|nr:hypothetical protein [Parapusillimonas granuli]MBB5213723.1 hypothetical protein [Parapusillimonas granuli]MEB2398806.1 hypothetical protein [Alcaligenaceae bacterium]
MSDTSGYRFSIYISTFSNLAYSNINERIGKRRGGGTALAAAQGQ